MSPQSLKKISRLALLLLSGAVVAATGCTSGMVSTGTTSPDVVTGPAFVVGTDAPLAAVVSFQSTITSVTANPVSGTPVCLISSCTTGVTVDFARFNGLQTLLDDTDVPQGTYDSVTITLGTSTIGYLNTTGAGAPTIQTITPVTYSPSNSVTVTLAKPLVVAASGGEPAGLRIDFDLAKSIELTNGAVDGTVDPTFNISTVTRTGANAHIDEFVGGVVTVPSGTTEPSSFTIEGPHGRNLTINTTSSTQWDGNASLSTLSTSDIVQVAGQMDPADQTLDADEVAILSDKNFYATGQITYVLPPTGTSSAAPGFDLYVRALEPTDTGLSLGQIADVSLTGTEKYYIFSMDNPLTQFLFNSSSLVAGQDVAIGGPASGAASASDVTVDRIHLRNWGFNGTIVGGSQNSGNGTFQMQVNGFAGVLIPTPVTVFLGGHCDFRYGFGGFGDLADGTDVRVVGLLLKNPTTGQLVLWARHVDGLDFTDFTTAAWQ
ncbi:MAG: DUF4382 domain-containing protein [Terracidiphilus sp.]|jgi:hypothetical protein